jgi:erythromycin esterase-like protein
MYRAEVSSWNLRDRHMAGTLDALVTHLEHRRPRPKVVVWEHNSHVGDARSTAMAGRGELNVGQLARQRYGVNTMLIGFSTYAGEVTAASDWGAPAERKRVRPALPESYEALLHEVPQPAFWVDTADEQVHRALADARIERAIGVIYRPETERQSHYLYARLGDQYDAVIHIDRTQALVPLDPNEQWQRGEPPETYPSGM